MGLWGVVVGGCGEGEDQAREPVGLEEHVFLMVEKTRWWNER